MDIKKSLLKLLNLEGLSTSETKEKRPQKAASPAPAAPSPAAAAWIAAGQARTGAGDATTAAETPPAAKETPWETIPERKGSTVWKILLRGALILLLVLLCITGLRSWFFPNQGAAAPRPAATTLFPETSAIGTAERFTESYLTWNEDNADARADALALDLSGGGAKAQLGWNEKGKQIGDSARVLIITPSDATHAVVTVTVRVTPFVRGDAGEWTAQPFRWEALDVPVAIVDGRSVVTGPPATVGVPTPGKLDPSTTTRTEDADTTRETKEAAESFFASYGSETDVSAVVAPSASIVGLGGSLEFADLTGWTVFNGDKDEREAVARVRWTTPSGAVLEQTYYLTLARVSSANVDRWQVATITGNTN